MTLRLPPLHVVFPPLAVFRQYPLPPDLKETWEILRGLSWVNKYAMTPPASGRELLAFHHNLTLRALEYRIRRLEKTGWLKVIRQDGKTNIYVTMVPADQPIDYSVKAAVHGGEPTSLSPLGDEELARMIAAGSEIESAVAISHKTPAMGCTSFSSTVVVDQLDSPLNLPTTTNTNLTPAMGCRGAIGCTSAMGCGGATDCRGVTDCKGAMDGRDATADGDTPPSTNSTPATDCRGATDGISTQSPRTKEERGRIVDALLDLDIESEEAIAKIIGDEPDPFKESVRDYSHVTPEYLEDWVISRRLGGGKLGGGYYRLQIREKREPPYQMSASQRAEYRRAKDEEWKQTNEPVDELADETEPKQLQTEPVETESVAPERIETERVTKRGVQPIAPSPYRADGTVDLWRRTCDELRLQTTRAQFDTWLQPAHALGWDDATSELVIGVHSSYAKEWFEARLNGIVLRTLKSVAECEVKVRYEVERTALKEAEQAS